MTEQGSSEAEHTQSVGAVTLQVAGTTDELRQRVTEDGGISGLGGLLADELQYTLDVAGTIYDVIEYDAGGYETGVVRYQVWHGDDRAIVIYDDGGNAWAADDEPDDPDTQRIVAAFAFLTAGAQA